MQRRQLAGAFDRFGSLVGIEEGEREIAQRSARRATRVAARPST
jgi:hypothetical protein